MKLASKLLFLEPIVLLAIGFAFWFIFGVRERWMWLLLLLPPLYVLRWFTLRRLDRPTPLTGWILALLGLSILNTFIAEQPGHFGAPHSLGWVMLGRLLLGAAIVFYFGRVAWQTGRIDGLVTGTIWLALLLAVLALTGSQWNEKINALKGVVDALPTIRDLPGSEGGFNANEIAGAISWVLPIVAGIAFYRWTHAVDRRDAVTVAAVLLGIALFLGQSRFALAGVLLSVFALVWLIMPQMRWRWVGSAALGLIVVVQLLLFFNIFTPVPQQTASAEAVGPGISGRDENSIENRLAIWNSGIQMLLDYPLTGVGLNFYRYDPIRSQYPVQYYVDNNLILPHAHNEWIQVAADLGFPGLIVFIGIQFTAGWMLLRCWRRGEGEHKALAAALAGGLLAHGIFALGDAITLWDRFIFLYWWVLGLTAALYIVVCNKTAPDETVL